MQSIILKRVSQPLNSGRRPINLNIFLNPGIAEVEVWTGSLATSYCWTALLTELGDLLLQEFG